ncbi:Spc97 [Tritrichomonas foetus]|uniref:Spc97 n=1 Tax=Tritrichomonas foetus TaxID=1144522 RepID=A0A1J4L634_9EUKA|nr:Spc97 [Tritrichomonas foetus]|eukprot:OHT17476.1 Spc97 [Tritrichomonas foetus]
MDQIVLPAWLENDKVLIISSEREDVYKDSQVIQFPPDAEDKIVVKDLLYCLVGGTGRYMKPDKTGKYVISCRMKLSNQDSVEQVLRVCDDFALIHQYSEGHFAFENGRITHAICAALRTVTSEYIQMIAKLEAYKGLTLPILAANLEAPGQLLRVLALLITELEKQRGCQALSIINTYLSSFRGSQQIRKLIHFIFESASVPLLSFVEKWIYNGEIDDPFHEFFIEVNDKISPTFCGIDYESKFWDERFRLVKERLPNGVFLSKNAVDKILTAGKSISVLTICGLKMQKPPKLTLQSLQRETVLDNAQIDASIKLIDSLRGKYQLMKYINMFHNVLLCARGDWLSKFLKVAAPTMSQPKDHIHIPGLNTTLKMSLPDGTFDIFYTVIENELVFDQVQRFHNASILNPTGHGAPKTKLYSLATSWEYLNVYSKLEWPLSLVFNSTVLRKYQLLFRTILMWRRLEKKFVKLWHQCHSIREIEKIRYAIQLFITAYIGFISTLVIHPQWSRFKENVTKFKSLDQLFKMHEEALDASIKGFFLIDQQLVKKMTTIGYICFQFIDETEKWSKSVQSELIDVQEKLQLAQPLFMLYEAFEKSVRSLINELNNMANREANDIYSDFVNWININDFYFHNIVY